VSFARCVLLCWLVLAPFAEGAIGALANAVPGATATPGRDAPADRYFGIMKMSPIGIRQNIDFLGRNYTWRTMTDRDIVRDAEWIEQALHDWQTRFPRDSWLAPTAFHLMQLYAEVQTADARAHAMDMLRYIVANWPNTKYGHLARVRLAQGFPPFHPEPTMRPTMTPTPLITPYSPAPSPTPAQTPTPGPTAGGSSGEPPSAAPPTTQPPWPGKPSM
jgi:hypothetical protein